ncbi:MAG: tetratricopeptide repeat protein [Gemmatales bacterium]
MAPTLQRAWQLYRFRRYPAALEAAMEFLAVYPKSAEAHCLLALIHGKQKQEEKAIEAAKAAIGYSPDWDYPYYVHALVQYWFDGYYLALQSLSEALRLQPTNPDYYELLSSIHYVMGHYQTSLETARQGLEQDAEHVGCLYRAGESLYWLNKKGEARRYFHDVLRLDPEHASAQGFEGYFLAGEGKYRQALPGLRLALREHPEWTFMQTAWKESLRGTYPLYGYVLLVKHWIYEKYTVRSFLLIMVLMACIIWWYSPQQKLSDWPAKLFVSLFAGLFTTAVLLFLLFLVLAIYLQIMSHIIFWRNRELRQTFLWSDFRQKHGHSIIMTLVFLAVFIAAFIKRAFNP